MADNQHWLDRWKENRIGFHESTANPYLQTYLPQFDLPANASIFLPLCGKALDIAWIAAQGYEVIGVEISGIAIEDFFTENGLSYERVDSDRFTIYRAGNITLLRGDFFDLRRGDLGFCALVYDRAALIAMSLEQRPAYCDHLLSIIPRESKMLLITLEYDQAEMTGPPYAVPEKEVRASYGGAFEVNLLERSDIIDERPRWRDAGLTELGECVYRLERRR